MAAIDSLIADFNDHSELPEAVFLIGEQYYYKAFEDPDKCLKVKSEKYLGKAKDVWERLITQYPQSTSIDLKHAYYFSAVCYRRLGQYERAIEYYQKIVTDWPDYDYAWSAQLLIGSCYERLRNSGSLPESEANPKIEQAYELVIKNYPDCGSAQHACLRLGQINFRRGRWADAAWYFELFRQKSPDEPCFLSVLYDLGRAYEEMGQLGQAAQVYGEFIEMADPNDARIESIISKIENWEV